MTEPKPPLMVERAKTSATRDTIRGAGPEILARPAGLYLASLRWDGAPGDPNTLSAAAFLSRL